jgi:hypothetical protein
MPKQLAQGNPPGDGRPSRRALCVGFVGLAAGLVLFVVLDLHDQGQTALDKYHQIHNGMPRRQVEQLLGTATHVDFRIDAAEIRVDVLKWYEADGDRRIRIEFVDDKVFRKEVESPGSEPQGQ